LPVDRLSALDESFLRLETDSAPMHVGWTLVLDGEAPSLPELRDHIAGRLGLLPRFRRRVVTSRLHDPLWVDDARFSLADHISKVPAPVPGGPAGLRSAVGSVLSARLERDRPLWRMQLVTGLGERRFALVAQVHHALVDGVAAVEMAQLLLDARPVSAPPDPRPFSPSPEPGILERALAGSIGRGRLARSAGSRALRALSDPGGVLESASELRRLATSLAALGAAAPATALNREIGPERSVAFAELPLHAAKELGRRCGATVNDVVLATASLALGSYLRRLGECHPWLRVLVPVSTRPAGDAGELGNRVSAMFIELPLGERDPRMALAEVSRQTRGHKPAARSGAIDGLVQAAGLVPPQLRDLAAWMLTRRQTFNAVVSSIPGPSVPLYLLGRRVRGAYPAVPLVQGRGLSIGVVSYCGSLHVGLCADPGVVPALVDLGHDFTRAFDSLRLGLIPEPSGSPRPPRRPSRGLDRRVLV
jgi:diacylglycerol O-acyltransferase / wax synthase